MEVVRTKSVDRYTPVTNIHFEGENKWVGNRKGVFQVHSPEQATNLNIAATEWSLLQTPSGNRDLRFPLEDLLNQMGEGGQAIRSKQDRISAAIFEEKGSQLWVGTRKSGLFQFRTQPTLQLIKRHSPGGSESINTLFLDTQGRLWIGTTEGCTYGKDGKWKTEEKVFSIKAFAQSGTNIWVMGDDLLWKVDAREKWEPIDIDAKLTESEVVDIAVDGNGLLWVASQIIARYDPATEEAVVFGPAEEFTSQDVSCMAIDAENAVWIGTNDKGLYLIQKADAMAVTCLLDKPLSCGANSKDASLKVTVSGGTEPYTYKWDGGLTGTNPQNLGPGEYSLTVTDGKGKSKSIKFPILNPNFTATITQEKPAGEGGAPDGAASVTVNGGVTPHTYKWDTGETTAKATKLAEGPHTVTVTDRAGCTATATVDIKRTVSKLNVVVSQTKAVGCAGAKDAALKADVSGGKTPYQYQWNTPSLMVGANLTGLPAGSYSVTITDATGQMATSAFTVKDAEPVVASIKVDAPASTGNADGKATVTAKGGTGNYTYKWSTQETSAIAIKLGEGTHSVTVTDGAGCTGVANINIVENVLPMKVTISLLAEIKCAGEKTARLRTDVDGGKKPYTYKWSSSEPASELEGGIPSGNYTVTATDSKGQTATASIEIKEPKAISLAAKVDAPASTGNSDGKATAKASGGTGNLAYKWDNGETTATATKLGPGSHTVTATDGNGCSATATVSITENILPLAVSISQEKDIKCAGEKTASLKAEASGGKGPFKFAWTGGGTSETAATLGMGSYDVTLTDAMGATATAKFSIKEPAAISVTTKVDAPASTGNSDGKATAKASGGTGNLTYKWDNGETAATATKLVPGSHIVTATDANGCSATATVSITENILPLAVSISQEKDIKCAGEKTALLKAEASGGKGPFKFAWTGGGTSETAATLGAGSYDVTLTDATGATATAKFSIKEPAAVSVSTKVDAPASTGNSDGKATAKASGGTGNLTYKWGNGETTATATKLGPGSHTVTATDANGCSATATVSISENILALEASISQEKDIKCAGDKTDLKVSINGGKGPYSIAWNSGSKSELATGIAAGSHTVTISDASGKSVTATKQVTEPKPVKANVIKIRPATTDKTSNGKATVDASGGSGSFTYKWDSGEAVLNAVALPAGQRSVTVTDENGCTATASFEVKTRIIPELSANNLRSGETIKLEKIYFQPDSTKMEETSRPTLDELYEFLQENTGIVIEVGGHTNGIPSHEFCDKLSTERAKNVAQYLVDKGLPANRITYKGYGKRKPVANNETPEGRAKNQRVEMKVVRVE